MVSKPFANHRLPSGLTQWWSETSSVQAYSSQTPIDSLPELLSTTQVPTDKVVTLEQVHAANIFEATNPGQVAQADGVWSSVPELALVVRTADCLPILLYHPKMVMALHVGWRSLSLSILDNAAQILKDQQIPLESVWVALGAAIGACHFEVKSDFITAMESNWSGNVESFLLNKNDQLYFDLPAAALWQLNILGFSLENVQRDPRCTYCASQSLVSYRRTPRLSHHQYSLVMLQSN